MNNSSCINHTNSFIFYFYFVLADCSASLTPIKIKNRIQDKPFIEAVDNESLNSTTSDHFQTNTEMFQNISSMYLFSL